MQIATGTSAKSCPKVYLLILSPVLLFLAFITLSVHHVYIVVSLPDQGSLNHPFPWYLATPSITLFDEVD